MTSSNELDCLPRSYGGAREIPARGRTRASLDLRASVGHRPGWAEVSPSMSRALCPPRRREGRSDHLRHATAARDTPGSAAQIALLGTGALARLPGDTRCAAACASTPTDSRTGP